MPLTKWGWHEKSLKDCGKSLPPSMEEAKTLCEPLGESALMSGDLCYAGCGRNLLYQCWGQLGVDRNHIRMGSEALALPT
jgi:hypothetical protein